MYVLYIFVAYADVCLHIYKWYVKCGLYNYTTVDPKQLVFFESEHSAACDVQSWETKDCKAEAATAVQSWETNVDTGRQMCKRDGDKCKGLRGHM